MSLLHTGRRQTHRVALGIYLHGAAFSKGYTAGRQAAVYAAGAATTLSATMTSGATTMTVASAAGFPGSGSYDVFICQSVTSGASNNDFERVTVTGGQGTTTWTITRGVGNTSASAHSATGVRVAQVVTPAAPMKIVHWFTDWGHWVTQGGADYAGDGSLNPNYWDAALTAAGPGAMAMMTFQPYSYSGVFPQATYSLANINAGNFDSVIDGMAADIAAWNKPIYIRFAHEMNGNWYPWGSGVNSNTAAGYISAFQRVHSRFITAGATKCKWVWCPNVGNASFSQFYPGDSYVDWLALDGYNRGTINGNTWQTFSTVFATDYAQITAVAPSKPIMIAETGCNESGGTKSTWLTDMFDVIPVSFPKIKAVCYFDYDQGGDFTQTALDSSAGAVTAWAAGASRARYQGLLT